MKLSDLFFMSGAFVAIVAGFTLLIGRITKPSQPRQPDPEWMKNPTAADLRIREVEGFQK